MFGIVLISKKRLHQLLREAHDRALKKGYELGCRLKEVETMNRGVIAGGYNLEKEINEILRSKGL